MDFSGGENRGPEERLAANEASLLQGFTHTDGTLRSCLGRTAIGISPAATTSYAYRHYTTSAAYTLHADASYVYVDGMPICASGTLNWRFTPWGDRLYMTYSGSAIPLTRWDGYINNEGTVTVAAGSLTTVIGTDTDWSHGVRKGDTLYYKVSNTWRGPYKILAVGSDTSLTINTNGVEGTDCQFIISRVHPAGIAPISSWTGTLAATTAYGDETQTVTIAGCDGGTYKLSHFIRLGDETAAIAWNADAADVKAALEATAEIAVGDVDVIKDAGVYYITFQNNLANQNIVQMAVTDNSLTLSGAPGGTATVATTTQGCTPVLAAGTYGLAVCLKNSQTGVISNPTYVSCTVATGKKITLSGYNTNPNTGSGWQADQLLVYRETSAGSGVYKLCKTVERDQAGYTFPTTVDVLGSEALTDTLEDTHLQPPCALLGVLQYNGRLYAWGRNYASDGDDTWSATAEPNALYFSAYNNPEYWDNTEYTPEMVADPLRGGKVTFGGTGNRIMDVAIEGGLSDATLQGNLLIATRNGPFHRWRGVTHDDFSVHVGAFHSTCTSPYSFVTNGDLIGWWTVDGPVCKQNSAASTEIMPIYRKLFPPESRPWSEQQSSGTASSTVCGVAWRDWFVWAWHATATVSGTRVNDRCLMYHLPTGTFKTYDNSANLVKARRFSVWRGWDDLQELYYVESDTGQIYQLESQTDVTPPGGDAAYATYWSPPWHGVVGVACLYRSGHISGEEFYTEGKLHEIELSFNKPATQQTVTITVIDAETGATLGSAANATLTAGTTGRNYVRVITGGVRARAFIIQISGTFTRQVVCYGLAPVSTKGKER